MKTYYYIKHTDKETFVRAINSTAADLAWQYLIESVSDNSGWRLKAITNRYRLTWGHLTSDELLAAQR